MTGPVNVWRVLVVGLVAGLLLGVAGLAAFANDGDVPRGTQVLGVDIGGQSRADAELILHRVFDARAAEPVEVERLGVRRSITPASISMVFEVDLTVGKAIRGGRPLLVGKRSSLPVIHLNRAQLGEVLGLTGDKAAATAAVKAAWLTGRPAEIGT